MQRNIIVTVEFSKGFLSVNALEQLSTNSVEIFSSKEDIKKSNSFLNKSIEEIENLVGGKVNEVLVVIEESEKVDSSIELVRTSIKLSGDLVSQKDVENLLELTRKNNKKSNKEIILIQPLQFEVLDVVSKKYSKTPISKKGESISATLAITMINSDVVEFIKNTIESQKLVISQILLRSQTISQNNLSENALATGASLIHVDENQTFVTINKNFGTVSLVNLYDAGYKKLIHEVAKAFGCSSKEAKDLILIYGNLSQEQNRVIFTLQEGISEKTFTIKDLTEIISSFSRRILVVAHKYLQQKGVQNLPTVISGKITAIKNFDLFAQEIFGTNVSAYKPMTFPESNHRNHNALGFITWNKRLNETYGKQFNTIIETNPNSFASLKLHKKRLWVKIVEKIGDKYERNN